MASLRTLRVPGTRTAAPKTESSKREANTASKRPYGSVSDDGADENYGLSIVDKLLLCSGIKPYPILKSARHAKDVYSAKEGALARLFIADLVFAVLDFEVYLHRSTL